MTNQKMKVELKITQTNGNSNKSTAEFPIHFSTVDSTGKTVYTNKGRAVAKLVFFLLSNKLCSVRQLLWLSIKYDLNEGNKDVLEKLVEQFEKG